MRRRLPLNATVLLLTIAAVAGAQSSAPSPVDQALKKTQQAIVNELVDDARQSAQKVYKEEPAKRVVKEPFANSVAPGRFGLMYTYLLLINPSPGANALLAAMDSAVDKQVTAAPSAGGPSTAQKGAIPAVLAFAVEHGAVAQETNGTKVTFRANPAGVVTALQGNGLVTAVPDQHSAAWRWVSSLAVAATFDTSLGPQAGTFAATGQQLAAWSITYQVHNGRARTSAEYGAHWSKLADSDEAKAYLQTATDLFEALSRWPLYKNWQQALVENVTNNIDSQLPKDAPATSEELARLAGQFQELVTKAMDSLATALKGQPFPSAVNEALGRYVAALSRVEDRLAGVYTFIAKGPLVTADWTTTRDPQLPDLYSITGVWEQSLGQSRQDDLTVNGAARFFRTIPTGAAGRFKSFDLTAEFTHPLGKLAQVPFVLTLSSKYQYLPNDTVGSSADSAAAIASGDAVPANGTPLAVAPKGHILIGQAKLTVPVKGTGVKIPLSLTVSNRTELVKEKDVRANFGITFDLDTLVGAVFAGK